MSNWCQIYVNQRWQRIVFDISERTDFFYVMTCFLTSWRTCWHHDVNMNLLTSGRTFCSHAMFWRHDLFLTLWRTLLTSRCTFDVITNLLTSWRVLLLIFWRIDVFCRHEEIFDVMTYYWRHDKLFDVLMFYCIMTNFLTSWCVFTNFFDIMTCFLA